MSFGLIEQSGPPVSVKDEGITLTPAVTSINTVGAGVTTTNVGNDVTMTISGGGGGSGNWAYDETLSGAINGSNKDFVLAHIPSPSGSLILQLNQGFPILTEDYTLSSATVSFVVAPPTGSVLRAKQYQY